MNVKITERFAGDGASGKTYYVYAKSMADAVKKLQKYLPDETVIVRPVDERDGGKYEDARTVFG